MSICGIIRGVHKVSLQFQQFITEASEKTDKWKLLQNERYIFKFFFFLSNSIHFWHKKFIYLEGQCSIKGGVDDQEHPWENIDRVRNRVPS